MTTSTETIGNAVINSCNNQDAITYIQREIEPMQTAMLAARTDKVCDVGSAEGCELSSIAPEAPGTTPANTSRDNAQSMIG